MIVLACLLISLPVVLVLSLSFGPVTIPLESVFAFFSGQDVASVMHEKIISNFRLPKAVTAILAGAALSVAGLQMQTMFRNPLADPFVLGVNAGASLGVAIVILVLGPSGIALMDQLGLSGNVGIVFASTLGAASVLGLVMFLSIRVDMITLLIMGLMIGYVTNAFVSIMMFFTIPERLQSFFAWTYGNFGTVTWGQMGAYAPAIIIGLVLVLCSTKLLNAFLLGETYARSLGVNITFCRVLVLLSASLLAGTVTGFCGPIGFIGVAVPHLCRGLTQTSDHRWLIPCVALMGGLVALLADFIAQLPGTTTALPLNSVTALLGAPIIIWVLHRQRTMKQAFGS